MYDTNELHLNFLRAAVGRKFCDIIVASELRHMGCQSAGTFILAIWHSEYACSDSKNPFHSICGYRSCLPPISNSEATASLDEAKQMWKCEKKTATKRTQQTNTLNPDNKSTLI